MKWTAVVVGAEVKVGIDYVQVNRLGLRTDVDRASVSEAILVTNVFVHKTLVNHKQCAAMTQLLCRDEKMRSERHITFFLLCRSAKIAKDSSVWCATVISCTSWTTA